MERDEGVSRTRDTGTERVREPVLLERRGKGCSIERLNSRPTVDPVRQKVSFKGSHS